MLVHCPQRLRDCAEARSFHVAWQDIDTPVFAEQVLCNDRVAMWCS